MKKQPMFRKIVVIGERLSEMEKQFLSKKISGTIFFPQFGKDAYDEALSFSKPADMVIIKTVHPSHIQKIIDSWTYETHFLILTEDGIDYGGNNIEVAESIFSWKPTLFLRQLAR
jgi:hypothetical protein